jgi:putative ABC transport system permease protein
MLRWPELQESFRIATSSLRVNLLRSILTTAGVVVGVVLVVLMGWTINGLDAVWEQTISIIGKDMMYIDKWNWVGGGNWRKMEARKDISLDQALVLQQRMESAEEIIPLIRKWGGSVSLGNTSLRCSVTGTTAAYGNTSAGTTLAGRFFNDIEERSADNVVVIGFNINKNLFPSQSAIGQSIKIAGIPYRIVGVIEKRGFLFMDFVDNEVFIPLHAFRGAYGFVGRSFSVGIKAGSERLLDIVRDEATGHMRSIRNTPPGDESDFSINEMKAFDQQAKNIRVGIWVVGMGLTLLAFIVGSIGIMNIMYVSVTERTKEIGVRKAIGARRSSILLQFLIESALLCLTGAVIAFPIAQLLVGSARFLAVSVFEMDWASVVSPIIPLDLLGIAVGVSIVVGLLAGLLPALKASGLDPVEALRSE